MDATNCFGGSPIRSGSNPSAPSWARFGERGSIESDAVSEVYDETIHVLKSAVRSAKLGREEELGALKRLTATDSKFRFAS